MAEEIMENNGNEQRLIYNLSVSDLKTPTEQNSATQPDNSAITTADTPVAQQWIPQSLKTQAADSTSAVEVSQNKSLFGCWADALTRMLEFSGRTTRYEFWAFQSVSLVIFLLMALVGYFLSQPKMVLDIFAVYFLMPAASSCTRRLHDISMSRFWALPAVILALTTLICWNFGVHNMVLLLFLTLVYMSYLFGILRQEGDEIDNKYGPARHESERYYLESRAFISFMTTFEIGLWVIYAAYLFKF